METEVKAKGWPKGKPRKPVEAVEGSIEIPMPAIAVLDRAVADPFGAPSSPISLKDPQFVTHWCNTELAGGSQLHKYVDAGWLKAKPEFLAHPDRFQFNISPEGYVTRGERHREILMYTTKEHEKRRTWAKTEANMRKMRMSKHEIQNAAAAQFGKDGDEAAEFIGRHVGGVEDNIERIATTGNE